MNIIGKITYADEIIPKINDEQIEQNMRLQNIEDKFEETKASIEINAKEIKDMDELNKKYTNAIKDEVRLFRQSVKSGVEEDLAKFDAKIQSISEATDAGLRDTVDKMQKDIENKFQDVSNFMDQVKASPAFAGDFAPLDATDGGAGTSGSAGEPQGWYQ